MKYNWILYTLTALLVVSCSSYKQVEREKEEYAIVTMRGTIVEMDHEQGTHPEMQALVDRYKVTLDKEMHEVVGESAEFMPYGRPESLLTNFTADVMKEYGNKHWPEGADVAIMNVHGHRAFLPKGKITLSNLYEIYPFDNAISYVELKGEELSKIFDAYARIGGAGISSNARVAIKNREVMSATLDGKPIDKERTYRVVTIDYLAEGNDSMKAFQNALKIENTSITLRDVMIDYVREQTAQGKAITSGLDGRITVE